jgi:putative ABC transport system substrate-binding protein
MERRRFIEVIAGGLLAAPRAAGAQPTGRVYRIGWLTPAGAGPSPASREAMRALGYVEGQTVAFESRSAEDDLGRLPRLAAELVHSKVDVIVAVSPPAIRAARQATDTIPIVMAYWGQGGLIESGIVASFASPGGNVTGLHILAAELDAKRLELLLQAVPKARKVGVLDDEGSRGGTSRTVFPPILQGRRPDHRAGSKATYPGGIRVARDGQRRRPDGLRANIH